MNAQTNNRPLFYLKFCSEEQFARDVCDGNLYANTAEFFRQMEINSGERGQGDRFETTLSIDTLNISIVDRITHQEILTAPKGNMMVRFGVDSDIPIVSFVGIPFDQMDIIEADDNHTSFRLPFTQDEYETIEKKFGKYCVVISGKELEQRIAYYCAVNGFDFIFDKVEYCAQNTIERIEAFNKGSKKRFLYKDKDLEYQREYRLAIGIEIPEDHFLRVGKLESAAYLLLRVLNDIVITVNYKSE